MGVGRQDFWDPASRVLHGVPICDSPQAGGPGAAIAPGLEVVGLLIAFAGSEGMCVFYKRSHCLMFLIDGPSVAPLLGSD